MSQRLDFGRVSPKLMAKYFAFSQSLQDGSIEKELRHLVMLRASQMNGCAFCVDMHAKEAKIDGERELRLHHLTIWRESPLFNARERAALAWTEALTELPPHGVADALYAEARAELSEQEIVDLTFAVMAINGWNRLNIAFAGVPGSKDAEYGLDKAGLG